MPRIETILEPLASAVADVLETAGELKLATAKAIAAQRQENAGRFSVDPASPWQHARRANEWVRELTERIASRAARDSIDVNVLLNAVDDVAAGRKLLPEGVAAMVEP
jgi:predicted proteasome-type protease